MAMQFPIYVTIPCTYDTFFPKEQHSQNTPHMTRMTKATYEGLREKSGNEETDYIPECT